MSIHTDIEWADSTLNLQMGCDGCELWSKTVRHCYAGILTERYAGRKGWSEAFDKPALFPERLAAALRWPDLTGTERPDKPWLNGRPRVIFLNDMGDTFTESLPLDWLAPHLDRMSDSPHLWLILTKRARRMRQFFETHRCPWNVWPGVSVTIRPTLARVDDLLAFEAPVRWLSVEPMLEPIAPISRFWDGGRVTSVMEAPEYDAWPNGMIDLCIMGGESGPGSRICLLDWLSAEVQDCRKADVLPFVKQVGSAPFGPAVGSFVSFTEWVNKARSWIGGSGAACFDARGRRCSTGADMARARDEDAFPVVWHLPLKLRDRKGGDPAEWPEDLGVREFPEVRR